MDFSEICRACMKTMVPWGNKINDNIMEMFVYCTNIKVTDDDKLPKQFCCDCCVSIEMSYAFIKKSRKVNITLKNLIFRSESSVIVETDSLSRTSAIQYQGIESNLISYESHSDNTVYLHNEELLSNINNVLEKQSESGNFSEAVLGLNLENDAKIQISPNENDGNSYKTDPECTERNKSTSKLNDELKLNICPVCRKEFSSKTWFTKHIENEHVNNKFVCKHCLKGFAKSYLLKQHELIHSETRAFSCELCSKSYKRRKQLKVHMKTHYDSRPYSCDQCSMSFKLKSVLVAHLKLHENEKPHLCYLCGASFTQAGNLTVHMRTHSGVKPHQCTQCGFASAAASSLRRHRLRHTEVRHYNCGTCQKKFYDASGLQRHLRVHSGETPYQCPLCSQCFSDSWKRKSHMMRQHRLQLTDIPRMKLDGQRI